MIDIDAERDVRMSQAAYSSDTVQFGQIGILAYRR